MGRIDKMIGERYGRQVVLGYGSRDGYVLCKCDCGTIHEVDAGSLTRSSGYVVSCGCYRSEVNHASRGNLMARLKSTKAYKSNGTAIRGVLFRRGRYEANITYGGTTYYLGRFDNLEDAVRARTEAESRYFKPVIAGK